MLAPLLASTLLLTSQTVAETPAEQVLRLTNEARQREGRPPLRLHPGLTKAAQDHAEDMARQGYFSHQSQDGSDMSDRVDRVSYRYRALGENIAMGQRTPQTVVAGWLKSPGHRTNILNAEYRDLGVGMAKDQRGVLRWVQVFGTPR